MRRSVSIKKGFRTHPPTGSHTFQRITYTERRGRDRCEQRGVLKIYG